MEYLGQFRILRTHYALHKNDEGNIEAYHTIGKKDAAGDIDPTDIERIITTATTTDDAIEQIKRKKEARVENKTQNNAPPHQTELFGT